MQLLYLKITMTGHASLVDGLCEAYTDGTTRPQHAIEQLLKFSGFRRPSPGAAQSAWS
jgi:hypothetical protein